MEQTVDSGFDCTGTEVGIIDSAFQNGLGYSNFHGLIGLCSSTASCVYSPFASIAIGTRWAHSGFFRRGWMIWKKDRSHGRVLAPCKVDEILDSLYNRHSSTMPPLESRNEGVVVGKVRIGGESRAPVKNHIAATFCSSYRLL